MTLRNSLCALVALWLVPAAGAQSLILTGAFDGPLTGGVPKAVEIYVADDIADLGLYAFGSANNGGGTDGAEFIFPSGDSASEGDFITLASEVDGFTAYFGTAPTYDAGAAAGINGDDALELFFDADGDGDFSNAIVIDTFGEIDVDGNGTAWEYLDGWAYRQDGTGPDGGTFELASWTFSGVDANDGETTNDTAAMPFPLGSYQAGTTTEPETYTALLRGENEVPAVETMARGGATAVLDGTMLTVTGTYAGLSGDYLFAHLHRGAAGENGPVAYTLTSTAVSTTEGNFLAGDNTFMVTETFADSVRAGLVYVNVHSDPNPGGELRGQLLQEAQALPFALSGDNEVPPVTTTASGFGTVTLDGATLTLEGAFSGLNRDYLFSHVHAGAAGANGPVVLTLDAAVGDDGRSGQWDAMMNTFELSPAFADSVRAGLAYVNVHSEAFPSGEIRGQIGFEGENMPVTLAEARAAGVGATVTVVGTVTRAQGDFTYIQDETAGLTVRQTSGAFADAVADGTIAPGVELLVTGELSEFNSLLQINGDDLSDFTVGATGDVPEAQVVTLAELAANGEAYEAELVAVDEVAFADEGTFASSTNYAITDPSDGSNAVALRVVSADDTEIDGTEIPELALVTAVVGQFSSSDPAVGYQLLPIQEGDVAAIVTLTVGDARAAGVGATVRTEGTVSRAMGDFTYIQDETGGLTIRQTSGAFFDAVADGTIAPGVTVTVTGELSEFNSLLQINNDALTSFEIGEAGDAPEPQMVTPTELNTNGEAYEAELVMVVDLLFSEPVGTILEASTNYAGTDVFGDGATLAMRVVSADDTELDGREVDGEFITATGIVGQFSSSDPAAGYQLLLIKNDDVAFSFIDSAEGDEALELALFAPAPNPATTSARIGFSLAEAGEATVAVYDALGRRVAVLADEALAADRYERRLDTARLAAGVYVVRLVTEAGVMQQTLTVVR